MAHNFRTALGGFHKEDVVRYLEYTNTKHQNQVNQLNTEISELRTRLEEAVPQDTDWAERCQALEEENQDLRAQLAALERRCAELSVREEQPEAPSTVSQELNAYRQAERIQKDARDRAELLYFQANHVLEEATAKVDTAAGDLTELTDQVMRQITQLQVAVSSGKQSLQEAAAILATLRPNR